MMEERTEITKRKIYDLTEAEFKQRLGIPDPEHVLMVRVSPSGKVSILMSERDS